MSRLQWRIFSWPLWWIQARWHFERNGSCTNTYSLITFRVVLVLTNFNNNAVCVLMNVGFVSTFFFICAGDDFLYIYRRTFNCYNNANVRVVRRVKDDRCVRDPNCPSCPRLCGVKRVGLYCCTLTFHSPKREARQGPAGNCGCNHRWAIFGGSEEEIPSCSTSWQDDGGAVLLLWWRGEGRHGNEGTPSVRRWITGLPGHW